MGLDMYLHTSHYISGWEFNRDNRFDTIIDLVKAPVTPDSPSAEVRVTVAYWRKANAIHGWFVDNVQDGVDDCRSYYVSPEKLQELRNTAQAALERYEAGERKAATQLLPPREGFFFGPTAANEWYVSDLKDTVDQLDRVLAFLADNPMVDIEYRASW